ncbi:hypothetical protein GCM10010411_74170 [Actinomadura fulvescens]|uniref:Type I-E CRISPR-associated protein Cse1/CasA n=1 Tax=Actinomadura fulvescens TaxID=46160 RepID=A0ABP6CTW2_9ACTN
MTTDLASAPPTGRPDAVFDLLARPWIPVQTTTGCQQLLSLRDTLLRAHELADLAADGPMEQVALHRLLLAVIHRALGGPVDHDQWAAWWRTGRLDAAPITRFLDEHAGRFDLWGARPFAQTPGLQTKLVPVDRLTAYPDRGAGAGWFAPVPRELTEAQAAVWLLWCQAYDTGGIRAAHGGGRAMGTPSGHAGWSSQIRLCGHTLAQTLLLSLPPLPPPTGPLTDPDRAASQSQPPPDDLGWWERRDPPHRRNDHSPVGPIHTLTWASRRILLHRDDDGMVRRVQIAAGDDARRLPGDPHTARPARRATWRTDTDPWRLLELLGALDAAELPDLDATDPDATIEHEPVPQPGVLTAVAERVTGGHLPGDTTIRITLTQVRYNRHRSMIEDAAQWQLAIPAAACTPGTTAHRALTTMAWTLARIERAVVSATTAAARTRPHTAEQIAHLAEQARMQLRADLDPAVRQVARDPSPAAIDRLTETARQASSRHLTHALDQAIQSGWGL